MKHICREGGVNTGVERMVIFFVIFAKEVNEYDKQSIVCN